jgi:hypothetical protein
MLTEQANKNEPSRTKPDKQPITVSDKHGINNRKNNLESPIRV